MASVLPELGVAVGAALILGLLFYRLGLPVIVGQLVAGMLVGPGGLGLIQDLTAIDLLASLGIVLLLLVVGLELDPRDLRRIGSKVLVLAILEFAVALAAGVLSGIAIGWNLRESMFLGVVLSISSTAIVGKMLLDRQIGPDQDLNSPIMAVLIIEDLIAIFLLLLTPELAVGNQVQASTVLLIASKGVLLTLVTVGFGRFVAPRIINYVSQYDLEVGETAFLLSLSFGFLFGVLSAYLGFSPAVGAFLMGLTLLGKHSRYVKEKIAPVKDLFIVFFFVSMGTLISPISAFGLGPGLALIVTVAVMGKLAGGFVGARLSGLGTPVLVGLILVPRGEFTLVLAKAGVDAGVVPSTLYPIAGFAVLATAIAAPLLAKLNRPDRRVTVQTAASSAELG